MVGIIESGKRWTGRTNSGVIRSVEQSWTVWLANEVVIARNYLPFTLCCFGQLLIYCKWND